MNDTIGDAERKRRMKIFWEEGRFPLTFSPSREEVLDVIRSKEDKDSWWYAPGGALAQAHEFQIVSHWINWLKSNHPLPSLALDPAEAVAHPAHYGGADNVYEAIKVIEAWNLGFCLGNTVKYISRAGKKNAEKEIEDLKKAAWYLARRIEQLEKETP